MTPFLFLDIFPESLSSIRPVVNSTYVNLSTGRLVGAQDSFSIPLDTEHDLLRIKTGFGDS